MSKRRKAASGSALKTLEAASKAERKLTYTEPPYYPRPVAEALNHLALRFHNKTAVAERAYRAALEQYPGDTHAKSPATTTSAP